MDVVTATHDIQVKSNFTTGSVNEFNEWLKIQRAANPTKTPVLAVPESMAEAVTRRLDNDKKLANDWAEATVQIVLIPG